MRLNRQQTAMLIPLIAEAFSIERFRSMLLDDLDVALDAISSAGNFEDRLTALIVHIQSEGRADELVQLVENNLVKVRHKKRFQKLCNPDFVGPSDDPHDAIILGRLPFVDRGSLRSLMHDFSSPSHLTSRVIVVRGPTPSGKSHSWFLIHHLASQAGNAKALPIRLRDLPSCSPVQLMERIRRVLGLSMTDWPELSDDPQDEQAAVQLADYFVGRLGEIQDPVWLVLDDLNGKSPTRATLELVRDLAVRIEQLKPDNLWLVLLGFDLPIVDVMAQTILEEDADALDKDKVRSFVEALATAYNQQLPPDEVESYVDQACASLSVPVDHEMLTRVNKILARIAAGVCRDGGFP